MPEESLVARLLEEGETREPVSEEELFALKSDADLPWMPTPFTWELRKGVSGEGPRAYDWSDKPHRLVFDACHEIERTRTLLREAADALERARDEARSEALDAVASYIMMYGGMSGGPESWADLADAIREDRFGPTDEQARIMHQVLTGGTF